MSSSLLFSAPSDLPSPFDDENETDKRRRLRREKRAEMEERKLAKHEILTRERAKLGTQKILKRNKYMVEPDSAPDGNEASPVGKQEAKPVSVQKQASKQKKPSRRSLSPPKITKAPFGILTGKQTVAELSTLSQKCEPALPDHPVSVLSQDTAPTSTSQATLAAPSGVATGSATSATQAHGSVGGMPAASTTASVVPPATTAKPTGGFLRPAEGKGRLGQAGRARQAAKAKQTSSKLDENSDDEGSDDETDAVLNMASGGFNDRLLGLGTAPGPGGSRLVRVVLRKLWGCLPRVEVCDGVYSVTCTPS